MRQAITDGELRVPDAFRSVHRLQREVAEIERSELLRRRAFLRVHQLELIAGTQDEIGSRLGAHTGPGDAWRGHQGPVGLEPDFKYCFMHRATNRLIELDQRLRPV